MNRVNADRKLGGVTVFFDCKEEGKKEYLIRCPLRIL